MNKLLSIVLFSSVLAVCYSTPTHHQAEDMWIANIAHGNVAYHQNPADYNVYRNVMDFGCVGDGVADDTACINTAISSGGRCGDNCGSSTLAPAIIYFPSGRYLVSSPIIMYYFSQLVGNALDRPVIVAAPGFQGMGVLDSDPYKQGGDQWYTNQNNFFRQVRNFVIDLTLPPATNPTTGIHWQVAQATSLVNIHFLMTPGSAAQGIWMENGSGGFMSDLTFEGGNFGMWVGNQQFLTKNLEFNNVATAIYMNWNWQWTFKNIRINNCGLGIDMSAPSDTKASGVGSILLLDSTITNTPVGLKVLATGTPGEVDTSGTILLDNVRVTDVPAIVADAGGATILPGGTTTVTSWGRGSRYNDESGTGEFVTGVIPAPVKSANLLDAQGNFFEKSRPQYENSNVNDFVSVKDFGAKGDGSTDDADAIQTVLNANANGKIVYFPHGSYVIGKTVTIPSGTRIIGELWSVLMASGPFFGDINNPQPMLRVGAVGEVGTVEISDIMFSTKGAAAGAILVEWNIKGSSQGAAGMWDCHFRVGGYQGSELQFAQCPKGQGAVPQCTCAFMLLHVTKSGSGYFENVWAWTADHDLDNGLAQAQVSIYTGRGVLIESEEGPVWLYGTQSEHNIFYQYQISNAKNVFLTMIQGETPYWQPGPKAPIPFPPNAKYFDPTYEHCADNSATCNMAWGLRAHGSSNIYLYGAGLYNFFNNYDQTCLDTETCQDAMIDLENNTGFYGFNVNTKAAINSVVADNTKVVAVSMDNANGFCQTVNALLSQA